MALTFFSALNKAMYEVLVNTGIITKKVKITEIPTETVRNFWSALDLPGIIDEYEGNLTDEIIKTEFHRTALAMKKMGKNTPVAESLKMSQYVKRV